MSKFFKEVVKSLREREKNLFLNAFRAFRKGATPPFDAAAPPDSMTGQFEGARCARLCQRRSRRHSQSRCRCQLCGQRLVFVFLSYFISFFFGFSFPHFLVSAQPVGVEMKYVDESLINLRHDTTSGVVCGCVCGSKCNGNGNSIGIANSICNCNGDCLLPLFGPRQLFRPRIRRQV